LSSKRRIPSEDEVKKEFQKNQPKTPQERKNILKKFIEDHKAENPQNNK